MITPKGYLIPDGYTATVVVFGYRDGRLYVLVGDREGEPFDGMLALPGGFVDASDGGHARLAAVRELREETGLEIDAPKLQRITVQDSLTRDPRGWIVDNVFGIALATTPDVARGDDLKNPRWVQTSTITEMAFDHLSSLYEAINLLVVSR